MREWPRIALVTPSFNQAQFIEATIESVLSQGYPNLAYAIVDGGSSDGSVEIIRRHAPRLTWWVSEPDRGQTDAIAKGFARVGGEILNWLNADDLLRPGALFAVANAYLDTRADLVVGGDRQFRHDPEQPVGRFRPHGYRHPDCLRFWTGEFRYHQPCTFFSRDAYERAGGLDESLHYVMDFDFYCRVLARGATVTQIDEELSAFRLHDGAKTSRAQAGFLRELRAVSQRQWPSGWGAAERDAMDRHCAECAVHQAADAVRHGEWRKAGRAAIAALRYDGAHAAAFAAARAARRMGVPRHG